MNTDLKNILEELVRIGLEDDYHRLSELMKHGQLETLRDNYTADQLSLLLNEYSTKNLISILKSLTILESTFKEFRQGSVSPVISIFWELYAIDPVEADRIASWILSKTNNPYLPFGTIYNGDCKTASEFLVFQKSRAERSADNTKNELLRQEKIAAVKAVREAEKATNNIFNAVKRSDLNAVLSLIAKGAKPDKSFKNGVSALELANKIGNEKIIAALAKAVTEN